jgi:excisionase family DNA binding protein
VAEAAARLAVTEATVRRWVASGLLPARRVGPGRRILLNPADLERLFSAQTVVRDEAE